jgi:hypothetical protein
MKKITIIDAYVSSVEKENLLRDCITSCRKLDTDIMLVAHCSVPRDIIEMVDYYIFDKDNRFNENSVYAYKQVNDTTVYIPVKQSHEYPIIKSMRNAFILTKGLGYEFFYFTEFDLAFSDGDVQKLKDLYTEMETSGKDFIFFRPTNAAWVINGTPIYNVYYETNFFAGRVTPVVEVFDSYFPNTLEEYNIRLAPIQGNNPNCLEFYFYDAFNKFADRSIVTNQHTKEYLADSKINVSSYHNTKCMIMRSTNQKDYLYITNENEKDYGFKVYIDSELVGEYVLSNKSIFANFAIIRLYKDCEIRVDVAESESDGHNYTISYKYADSASFINNGYITTSDAD